LETGQPRIGEKPQIAARDKAKATASAPTENLSAMSPARASTAKRRPANTPRRSA